MLSVDILQKMSTIINRTMKKWLYTPTVFEQLHQRRLQNRLIFIRFLLMKSEPRVRYGGYLF